MLTATLQAAKALLEDAGYRVFHKDRLAVHNRFFAVAGGTPGQLTQEIAYKASRSMREMVLDLHARGGVRVEQLPNDGPFGHYSVSILAVLPENNR